MKKLGKLLVAGLLVGTLCTGTVTAKAEMLKRTIGDNYSITAGTIIVEKAALAQTATNSQYVWTGVDATSY